jgi:hypothetical protein
MCSTARMCSLLRVCYGVLVTLKLTLIFYILTLYKGTCNEISLNSMARARREVHYSSGEVLLFRVRTVLANCFTCCTLGFLARSKTCVRC